MQMKYHGTPRTPASIGAVEADLQGTGSTDAGSVTS